MGNCNICDKGTDNEVRPSSMSIQKQDVEKNFEIEKQFDMYNKRHFPEQDFGINLVKFLETKYKT